MLMDAAPQVRRHAGVQRAVAPVRHDGDEGLHARPQFHPISSWRAPQGRGHPGWSGRSGRGAGWPRFARH